MTAPKVIRVAINAPLSRLFDYLPPNPGRGSAASLAPGARVRVPFGKRRQTGVVMETAARSELPPERLRPADSGLDTEPLFREQDLWLLRFASDYYHHPIGEVVAAAMPAPLRQGKPLKPTISEFGLSEIGRAEDMEKVQKRAPKQAELMTLLQDGPLNSMVLDEQLDGWRAIAKRLLDKEWIIESRIESAAQPADRNVPTDGPTLNTDQANALQAIRNEQGFKVSLLDGVTGSGKTEVYLHLMQEALAHGKQVMILVPEIGLTPQLVNRLQERLGEQPAVLHSGLTDSARLDAWRQSRAGTARVLLGTRSAVFTPMKNLGLIIIDEEHDNSLKQQEGFRYSARDLAIARAKHADIPIVLGTATPSLETLKRCADGAYQQLRLPARAAAVAPPLMRLIDLTVHANVDGVSEPAITAIRKTLQADGQVLIFLNRRGFAPTLICGGCGHIAECARCDARMTVHAASKQLRCHHCGATRALDTICAECSSNFRPLGHGTERLEDELRLRFPDQAIARVDSDSTRLKGTMDRALAMATTGETKILVGTQMLSKGHHFPKLMLVVVINADQGLFSTDFRASEKLAQGLVQVAGRAGRVKRQGEVLIQTAFPSHPFWGELFSGGYAQVSESALDERMRTAWPPYSRLALLRASAHRREDAREFLEWAREVLQPQVTDEIRVLGPVSAPMERRAGRFRAQLLLQSVNRQALHTLLGSLRLALEGSPQSRKVRWSIDVDPIELF